MAHARRPLLALIVLVLLLAIGYAVRGSRSDDEPTQPTASNSAS